MLSSTIPRPSATGYPLNTPRFHAVMAEDSGQSVLSSLESHIVPLLPGLDGRLRGGIRVLDGGCGSGRIVNRLAGIHPNSRFTGIDLSPEAIELARGEASGKALRNAARFCTPSPACTA